MQRLLVSIAVLTALCAGRPGFAAQPSSSQDTGFIAPSVPSRFIPNLQQLAMKTLVEQPAQLAENIDFIHDHPDLKHLPAQSIGNALIARIGGQFREVGSYGPGRGVLNAKGTKYASYNDREIREWDLLGNTLIHSLRVEGFYFYPPKISSVQFSDDDTKIIGGFFDGSVRVWNAQTGELEVVRQAPRQDDAPAWVVAISPDNRTVVVGSDAVRVWDVAREDPLYVIRENNARTLHSLAFSPDGSMLASADDTPAVKLRKSENGELRHLFPYRANVLAFNREGNILAAGLTDKTIGLWDSYSGKLLSTLSGHIESVHPDYIGSSVFIRSLAFSPDGMLIASGADDRTVKLWRPNITEPLHTLTGLKRAAISLAFSSDGTKLIAGLENGDVVLWELGYQKDLQEITDAQELTFLLNAAQEWLSVFAEASSDLTAGKASEVDATNPIYQKLITRFPYLNDERLFAPIAYELKL